MKIWIDREGKQVEGKEFVDRWKKGIENVTPLQQAKVGMFGYALVLLGIIWGMVYSGILGQWWLLIILSGSLIISGMQIVGALQKLIFLIKIDKEVKGGLN